VPSIDPAVKVLTNNNEFLVRCMPPDGFRMGDVSASRVHNQSMALSGLLTKPAIMCEYVSRRRAGAYEAPNERSLIGVYPAGTIVRGSPPSHAGWIALEDEEDGWALDDGSWALRTAGSPAVNRRFCKTVSLPPDAVLSHATTQECADGNFVVHVPRQRSVDHSRAFRQSVTHDPPAVPPSKPSPASRQQPRLTKERLLAIQRDCMADGIDIDPAMLHWTEGEVRDFFHSGGRKHRSSASRETVHQPAKACEASAARQAGQRASPCSHMNRSEPKTSTETQTRGEKDEPNKYDVLMPGTEPVLVECDANIANVQSPTERIQEWEATKCGGFVRTA